MSIQGAWADIKQGKNIILYLTIALAIVLVFVNLLVSVPSSFVDSLILAVLVIALMTNYQNKVNVDSLLKSQQILKIEINNVLISQQHLARELESTKALQKNLDNELTYLADIQDTQSQKLDDFLDFYAQKSEAFPESFSGEVQKRIERRIRNATKIWIIGTDLDRTISLRANLIRECLLKGVEIKIVFINPHVENICNVVAQRNAFLDSTNYRTKVINSLESMRQLQSQQDFAERLDLRIISYPLNRGGIFINPRMPDEELFGWELLYQTKNPKGLKYHVTKLDGNLYNKLFEEGENVIKNSLPVLENKV